MLMHQGIGLDAFNELPPRKALHALYECCFSVAMANKLVRGRPYAGHADLFRKADALLFSLSEESVDDILQAYPRIGTRPRSTKSAAEQCSVADERPEVMAQLRAAAKRYEERFGERFVMFVGNTDAAGVLTSIADRLDHDADTERKVVRNELAKINRTRLERMLGPEGGYHNW
ncbi:MAG TPA: 2-oxo-4-hydroxy-4-carboxy-5-ureidoimidazoline decarboxylase [Mycobacterium sp.]|nr:2-oxo-4-hydroxy-4-carboxy-5-ureidoimidazoline decarboxylase [Mycobacterium sp.]